MSIKLFVSHVIPCPEVKRFQKSSLLHEHLAATESTQDVDISMYVYTWDPVLNFFRAWESLEVLPLEVKRF